MEGIAHSVLTRYGFQRGHTSTFGYKLKKWLSSPVGTFQKAVQLVSESWARQNLWTTHLEVQKSGLMEVSFKIQNPVA